MEVIGECIFPKKLMAGGLLTGVLLP